MNHRVEETTPNQCVTQAQERFRTAHRLLQSYGKFVEPVLRAASSPVPSAIEARDIIEDCRELIFPGLVDGSRVGAARTHTTVDRQLHQLAVRLQRQIRLARACVGEYQSVATWDASAVVEPAILQFLDALPAVREALVEDAATALASDPAAKSLAEILLSYPGHYAITVHRLAHALLRLGIPLLPRMMSEHAHRLTGVDIHPAAQIGPAFFIDHGTGSSLGKRRSSARG